MNFKIIATAAKYPDLLLYLDEDDEASDCVMIHVVGFDSEGEEVVYWDKVTFTSRDMCRRYILDYSVETANEFCEINRLSFNSPDLT